MNRALGHALGLSSAEATNFARSAWERVDRAGLLLNPGGPAGGASARAQEAWSRREAGWGSDTPPAPRGCEAQAGDGSGRTEAEGQPPPGGRS